MCPLLMGWVLFSVEDLLCTNLLLCRVPKDTLGCRSFVLKTYWAEKVSVPTIHLACRKTFPSCLKLISNCRLKFSPRRDVNKFSLYCFCCCIDSLECFNQLFPDFSVNFLNSPVIKLLMFCDLIYLQTKTADYSFKSPFWYTLSLK